MIGFLRGPMVGLSDNAIFYLLENIENNLYDTMEKLLQKTVVRRERGINEKYVHCYSCSFYND